MNILTFSPRSIKSVACNQVRRLQPTNAAGILFLLIVTACSSSAAGDLMHLKVPDGTSVRLSLTETLSSATNEVDNPVHFEVMEDVTVSGIVAISKGSTAVGHVVEAEGRKRMGRAGKLNFSVDHVKAPDGGNLRLRASSTRKGEDKTGTVIIGAVVLSPLFLIMRGKDITIPKGTEIAAYIDGDREINMSSLSSSGPNASISVSGQTGAVSFKSEPDGADITVDGKFLGTTPSIAQLTPGDHSIVIAKVHFESWMRTMTVAAGSSANVNSTLEKTR
jgi:hypothetical protein